VNQKKKKNVAVVVEKIKNKMAEELGDEVEDDGEEVEMIDLVYDDKGIDDLIKDLLELKKNKDCFMIPVDGLTQVVIHHEDDPELKELEAEEEEDENG